MHDIENTYTVTIGMECCKQEQLSVNIAKNPSEISAGYIVHDIMFCQPYCNSDQFCKYRKSCTEGKQKMEGKQINLHSLPIK